jgi:hypothetical protein
VKFTVPATIIVTDLPTGGILFNVETKESFRLDGKDMKMWKSLSANGTMEAARAALLARTAMTEESLADELNAFVAAVAERKLVQITDESHRSRVLRSLVGDRLSETVFPLAKKARRLQRKIRAMLAKRLDVRFDLRFGTDTTGHVRHSELGVTGPSVDYAFDYEATPCRAFRYALRRAVPMPDGYVFVDYGSGKGRALLLASHLAFKRIIGVEFSNRLHAIAQRNIQVYRGSKRRCLDITSVCCDATEFILPDDDLLLYFYGSFVGPVFETVLDRISKSFVSSTRRLIIIAYGCPKDSVDQLASLPFVSECKEIALPHEWSRTVQYRLFIFSNAQSMNPEGSPPPHGVQSGVQSRE